ncbi:MAG TPA: molybdopterin-binding/glycosyltransferase family 2 protein [Gammaproteobacteria bacterium]|nr:molybdopterin-binding/glycosyltransferase family 2 protein [Gammaproteobacteria bacterium]
MKFGELALAEAEGAILAHSLRLDDGALKKGRVLTREDIGRLEAAKIHRVTVARLEPGDVGEDEAAALIAEGLAGDDTRKGGAFTGRCNLFARETGLLLVDAAAVDAVNAVDEAITVATLSNRAVVTPKQMIATVKIIPFAVAKSRLDEVAERLAGRPGALRVAAFKRFRAGLVQTRLPGTREPVLDKTAAVIARRTASVGGRLTWERRCDHSVAAVGESVDELLRAGAGMVLVVGASAIVDRRDVVPSGIVAAGGEIVHYGMPMDPGNLILVARRGAVPLLGLPGSARSLQYNGIDEILRSLAAGLEVDKAAITRLGVGGLLKETPDRPLPRGAGDVAAAGPKPRVYAVVLAAGQSRRMGGCNKLLEEVEGVPLVRKAVDAAAASICDGVLVVTGHEAARVESAVARAGVETARCRDYASGLSASLRAGIAALPEECDAAVVCLGDMPYVSSAHIDRLIADFDPLRGRAVCVPTFRGKRGNPVLWDRRFFSELMDLKGDVGARHLIGEHAHLVCEVAMDDDGVLTDVDTPQDLIRGQYT